MKLKLKNNLKNLLIILTASIAVAIIVCCFGKLSLFIILGAIFSLAFILIIFKNPLFGIFLIAFLLPFERIGSFELMGITIRASQIFALITLIAWFLIFLTKKINFKAKNPLIIPLSFFLGFSILSMINALNLKRAIAVFLFNAFVIVISLMIPNLIKSKKSLKTVIKIILISSLIVSIFGIYQFLGDMFGLPNTITGLREHYTKRVFGFPRIQSTFLEPLYFADFLLIPIALSLSLFLSRKKQNNFSQQFLHPFWLIIIAGFGIINLILTLSRGGLIAFAFLLLLIFLVYFRNIFKLRKIAIICLVALIAFLAIYNFLKIKGEKENIETFIKQATSFTKGIAVKERFTTYKQAWEMIQEHPLLGYGVGNFGPYAAQSPYLRPKEGWLIVNNEFLEIWAEVGIFGLFSFLAMIIIIIVRSIKAIRSEKENYFLKNILIGLLIAFLAILVQWQTFSTLYILHIWFLISLLVSAQNLALESSPKSYQSQAIKK